jgi:diadenosine tetraphosphate (Ap4A) HIT family hydrolase
MNGAKLSINKYIKPVPATSTIAALEDQTRYSNINGSSSIDVRNKFTYGNRQQLQKPQYKPRVPANKNYLSQPPINPLRNIISTPPLSYADIAKQPPVNPGLDKRESMVKPKSCLTCKVRGKVATHIISESECGDFLFHFDLNNRPIILITPKIHVESMSELSDDMQLKLHKNIVNFCKFWSINSYEVSYNVGEWQKNSHLHVKIKMKEKQISRMRGDHFNLLKLEKRYNA